MSEDVGARRRASARRSFSEHTLPAEYLERLEQKRKQLDESIHKYIAAKEREYKLFERELRQEHKLSQGQDGSRGTADARLSNDQNAALASERIAAADTVASSPNYRAQPHAGASSSPRHRPQDSKSANEREKYLEGLFTPAYLSALDDRGKSRLERTLSDPPIPTSSNDATHQSAFAERSNSDSFDQQAKPRRPSQLVLAQRTSSSGSSADGRLASAMRSPTHRPKHKRVSLAVGDSIVAPSDNVPAALSQNTTPSHSRKRSQVPEHDHPLSTKRLSAETEEQQTTSARAPSPLADEVIYAATETMDGHDLPALPPAAVDHRSNDIRIPMMRSSTIDADGDLFDLVDVELNGPFQQEDEDADNVFASDEVIVGRVKPGHESTIPPLAADGRTRYDPATGLIPEPEDEKEDSAVPYLAFGPSSSVAPREPGFRRPSVIDDPIYRGPDYQAAERKAVENDVYGSSANKPKGSLTPGSLGESYMAKHAEEMMRARLAKRSTSVES